MADTDLSPARPAPAHPMANPGYGKRSAPEQLPRGAVDFAHLPAREASIAALIDRLPEGAATSGKALAAAHPCYGQAACLTALRRLSEAGHLRRSREHVVLRGGSRWVTRTYFSRTPRSDAWWDAALRGETPPPAADDGEPPPPPPSAPPLPKPSVPRTPPVARRPAHSPAYEALADLCLRDPRLTLSAADCEALEPLAAQWLDRDPSGARFTRALTAGLPPEVHSARGILHARLRDKMPPERREPAEPARGLPDRHPVAQAPPEPPPLRLVECTVCGTPGRPHHLPGGLCSDCRPDGRPAPDPDSRAFTDADIHARAEAVRRAIRSGTGTVPAALRREVRLL